MANIVKFFQEVKQEGKKVSWPTRKETTTTTILVFIMVLIVTVFLFTADWAISSAIEVILRTASK